MRKKARKTKVVASTALTKAIKSVFNRATETKYRREQVLDSTSGTYVNFNSQINSSADWYSMIPLIGAGTSAHQKIGKIITPTKLTGHWRFKFAKDDVLTRDIFVHLYIVTSKLQKSYGNSTRNGNMIAEYDRLLDAGDGTDVPFDGTWNTSKMVTNTDAFHLLKHKVFRLSKASGDLNGAGVVGQYDGNGRGQYCNSSREQAQFSYTFKKVPKLHYDSSAQTFPTNFAPWFAVGYTYANGIDPDTTTGLLQVDFVEEMRFKDD